MLKEELKNLYKTKPELIAEHKRLVNILRTGSKKEQLKEASKQLKELKEMMDKADRCWEGYEPVPGKKPYEKGSCAPIKKQEVVSFEKEDDSKNKGWRIKIKGKDGYHQVKDVKDMGAQQHNSYVLEDGSVIPHHDVEDLDISGSLKKSNYGPKGMNLYNPVDNIKRKSTRTGEVLEDVGRNKAVRQYTSSSYGTAAQQAASQSKADKKKSAKNPVKTMADMSPEEIEKIKQQYAKKAEDEIEAIKQKYTDRKEKDLEEKIKDIKEKNSSKKDMTDKQLIQKIKDKYLKYFK